MDCVLCAANIRGGSTIVVFTDSIYNESGRFIEHLTTDNLCSVECLKENLGLEPNEESCQSEIGKLAVDVTQSLKWVIALHWVGLNLKARNEGGIKLLLLDIFVGMGVLKKICLILNHHLI